MSEIGDFRYTLTRIKVLADAALNHIEGVEEMPDDTEFKEILVTLSSELFEQAEHLDEMALNIALENADPDDEIPF